MTGWRRQMRKWFHGPGLPRLTTGSSLRMMKIFQTQNQDRRLFSSWTRLGLGSEGYFITWLPIMRSCYNIISLVYTITIIGVCGSPVIYITVPYRTIPNPPRMAANHWWVWGSIITYTRFWLAPVSTRDQPHRPTAPGRVAITSTPSIPQHHLLFILFFFLTSSSSWHLTTLHSSVLFFVLFYSRTVYF